MMDPQSGDTFQPGDLLNNTYRIEAMLGRGGTSEVYRARSEIAGRVVAVKVLKSEFSGNEDYLSLMIREEEIRDIRHDAVVRYSENHRLPDGQVYLVMDFVDGPGLDAKLQGGGMSAEDLIEICKRVASGLKAAHAKNIVHRDLSPDNIILRNGNPDEAVIIDFGIAKDDNPGASTIIGNEFAGKYAYAAPEQMEGKSDNRTDIYSLGALLLATFRGAAPEVGNNPMEVVQRKSQPLDTSGVPEPLAGLIDRMTAPDPASRFQSVDELLAAVDGGGLPEKDDLDDLLAPPPPKPEPKPEPRKKPAKPEPKKSGGGMVVILAVLVLLGAIGGGVYFTGLHEIILGPRYPVVSPYTLTAERTPDGMTIEGHAPSEEVKTKLETQATAMGGSAALILASGTLNDGWGDAVSQVIGTLGPLPEWRLVVSGNEARITGLSLSRSERDQMVAALDGPGFPAALNGQSEIVLGPRLVAPTELRPLVTGAEDCGELRLVDPPPLGYGIGSTITITGNFASEGSRSNLLAALGPAIGDRTVDLRTRILNPALCQLEGRLPDAAARGLEILLSWGDREGENATGVYRTGENPVIDVRLPPDVTGGHLWVSIVDVSGKVFHLLPNRVRPDAGVVELREGVPGQATVRVAYGLNDVEREGGLAFLVDDSSLGMSEILVFHASTPLFDFLRPTEESIDAFIEAIDQRIAQGAVIDALAKRILTTIR